MQNRIKEARKALHLSQREFGEKLGVSRDVISNIEYSRVPPKALLIKHICEVYNVNEAWLQTGEGPMFNDPPRVGSKVEEAVAIFQSLRPEFQEYALAQIRQLAQLQDKDQLEPYRSPRQHQ